MNQNAIVIAKGSDDEIKILTVYASDIKDGSGKVVAKAGQPINWQSLGTQYMMLFVNGLEIDSRASSAISFEDGLITIKPGKIVGLYADREYNMSVMAYDHGHPDGQLVIHPQKPTSNILTHLVDHKV